MTCWSCWFREMRPSISSLICLANVVSGSSQSVDDRSNLIAHTGTSSRCTVETTAQNACWYWFIIAVDNARVSKTVYACVGTVSYNIHSYSRYTQAVFSKLLPAAGSWTSQPTLIMKTRHNHGKKYLNACKQTLQSSVQTHCTTNNNYTQPAVELHTCCLIK